MVQNRDETFEHALDSYKKLFLVEKDYCVGKRKQEADQFLCKDRECYFYDGCTAIYEELERIKKKEIENFFNTIKECYTLWIDAKTSEALEKFEDLLKTRGLIYKEEAKEKDVLLVKDIDKQVFFRGRKSDEFLGKRDMFHVPYNKRYNLRNERFSLTGQPILYLGNSIADIVEELDIDLNDKDAQQCLKVSSFEIKDGEKRNKIFDLRCNIGRDMKNVKKSSFTEEKFYRNILASICSFQKRKELEGYAFKEEYVIPQMLAQILKKNDYDGICYYSTKKFYDYRLNEACMYADEFESNMLYRENIVLFTHASKDGGIETFDEKLWDDLEISMPLCFRDVKRNSEQELENLYSVINERCQAVFDIEKKFYMKNGQNGTSEKCKKVQCYRKKVDAIIKTYHEVFSKLKKGDKLYNATPLGQIQLQLLIGILNRILVEIEISNEEGEAESKVQCCDVYGRNRQIDIEKNVHERGILHKAQVYVLSCKLQDNDDMKIAMHQEGGGNKPLLFCGHYLEQISLLQDIIRGLEARKIGSFLQRKCVESDKGSDNKIINFEYVEVMLVEITGKEYSEDMIIWKTLEEAENELFYEYDRLSETEQKTLPIVLEYFFKKKGEGMVTDTTE